MTEVGGLASPSQHKRKHNSFALRRPASTHRLVRAKLNPHTSAVDGLWFVLFVGIAIVAAGIYAYLKHQRRQALLAFAQRHAFAYTAHAPPGLLSHGFPLFLKGDGRGAENGIVGKWKDMDFRAADFWYYEERSRDAQGRGGGRSYYRFSVAAIEVPAWLPDLTVSRENIFTAIGDRIGLGDIDFESEEFNRAMRVKARDRKFAFELIDPRMMQWLLTCDRRFGFEVHGKGILIYSKRLKPSELLPLIGSLQQFRDRIPRLVWTDYGYEPKEDAR